MKEFTRHLKPQSAPGFSRRADELRSEMKHFSAEVLAERTGTFYDSTKGCFIFLFNGQSIRAVFPEMKFFFESGQELAEFQQLELLYYFVAAEGFPHADRYVSFADLPGGRIYDQAFQGYTGNEVVKVFGENIEAFKTACLKASGQPVVFGDAAFVFQVLPKISIQIVYWLGDEDFPSSCKILFDAAITHFYPIEGCAIIGNGLVHRVIKNKPVK